MASTYLTLYISYNANGGSGAPGTTAGKVPAGVASDYPKMVSATVATGSPVRSGYTFLGWSMSMGGSPSIHGGQTLTHTFSTYSSSSQTYTIALYAVWSQQTYTVTYLPGSYGSGSSATDTKYGGTTLTLRGRLFTRSGYYQSGWSTSADGSGFAYGLGGSYSLNAAITLYPYWTIIKSTITSVTSSVPADGSTQGTVQINRPDSAFTHKVVIQLGSRSQEITNVGLSCTFTIPQAWIDQIPAATSATAKVLLYTYRGSSQVGTADTKNFTITVPASIVPSVSVTSENLSDNATVDGWDTLVQGFSKIKLTATATAGSGSSIASVAFSGDGVSQTGTALTATSAVLTNAGSRTWTVVVTDRRGRTASATITRTVHEYRTASVEAFAPFRSNALGVEDPGTGTYITVTPVYSIASCDGHNSVSVKKIEYKINTGSTWTVGQSAASSGTTYTFGTISVLYAYDVRITVTDALGSTVVYSVQIPSAIGFSFGFNGQCARLGGPVQYDDRLEVDFKAQFDDDVDIHGDLAVTGDASFGDVAAAALAATGNASIGGTLTLGNRQLMKTLWTGTWASGNITVTDVSKYKIFLVRMDGQGTMILAMKNGEYFRGMGGYASSSDNEPKYYLSATESNGVLTMEYCRSVTTTNSRVDRTVVEIIGVI